MAQGDTVVRIEVDLQIFSLQAIQKAAAKFARFASFELVKLSETAVEVVATPIAGIELTEAQFTGLFRNELLDQNLREIVSRETESERNLILAYAFSNTKLIQA